MLNLALLSGAPAWVLKGATVDLDFANNRYWGGSLSSSLSISRASSGTDLLPSSASGASYNTFLSNVHRVTQNNGLLIEEARTNNLLNSTAPVTQTTASLATGTYTLWVNGSGTATPSGGTATITGAAAATNGSPNTFVVTVAGTVVITVAGSLNAFQLELGAAGTSLIATAGATATRAADSVLIKGAALSALNAVAGFAVVTAKALASGNIIMINRDDGTNVVMQFSSSTGIRTLAAGTSTTATLGNGGNWSVGVNKGAASWSSSGTSVVADNGALATGAAAFSGSATFPILGNYGGGNYINGYVSRLTLGMFQPSAAALGAFTV